MFFFIIKRFILFRYKTVVDCVVTKSRNKVPRVNTCDVNKSLSSFSAKDAGQAVNRFHPCLTDTNVSPIVCFAWSTW